MSPREMMYLGDHTALTRTIFGHKMYVDTRDVSLTPHILLDGAWEPWTAEVLRSAIRPGMVVVDVGANMGYFSLLMAALAGPTGKLVAFEANPDVFRLLTRTLEINGFHATAECRPLAVMDHAGSLTFRRLRDHLGSSSFYVSQELAERYHDQIDELVVPCISLDEYFSDESQHIDVIKIDVEGAETQVIAGAKRLLERSPHAQIIMEFTPGVDGEGGNMAAVETLTGMGFEAWAIRHDSTVQPTTFEELDGARELLMLYLRRPETGASASNDELALMPDVRNYSLLAFADELIADPALLSEFAKTFSSCDNVSLVAYGPGADPDEVCAALRAQIAEVGLDKDGSADVVAHFGSPRLRTEHQLARHMNGVFSNQRVRAPFRSLERFGAQQLGQLRNGMQVAARTNRRAA